MKIPDPAGCLVVRDDIYSMRPGILPEAPLIEAADVEAAIEELVFCGGSLNRILLGVGGTQNLSDEDG